MITNANITSWQARTGSSAEGKATYGAEQISVPVRCAATAPNASQRRTAEEENFAVDLMVTHQMVTGPVAGDLIACDHGDVAGKVLMVRKRSLNTKPGLRAITLFCTEVG